MSSAHGLKVPVSAEHAAALIPSSATVLVDGSGGGVNEPDLLLRAIERRFMEEGEPSDLTLVHPAGIGDGNGGGVDRFAHEGLVRRVIGAHWSWSRRLQAMARAEEIEAYCLPQGVMSHLLRATAAGAPGVVTHVGLGTFVDPRLEGGRLNERASESVVEVVEMGGREWLYYSALPIDVAVIRGSRADARGNIVMDREGLYAETLSAAQAARNSGGLVFAQVKEIVDRLDPRQVKVPGVLIDALVVHPEQRLSIATAYDPALTGERPEVAAQAPMEPGVRKLIARRAAAELRLGDVVNLGFGMPDGVASVLAESGTADGVTFTLEQGHVGGVPATGTDFGLARGQEAMLDAGYQFDGYDGGWLDVAILSFAEVDRLGNVNVSKFGDRIAGVGGFINISQGAKRCVFVGTFTTGGLEVGLGDARVRIGREGRKRKFVERVEQVSWSAERARDVGQSAVFITERAVFELGPSNLTIVEVAPGIDIERDVFAQMGFEPDVAPDLRPMDPALLALQPGAASLGPSTAVGS